MLSVLCTNIPVHSNVAIVFVVAAAAVLLATLLGCMRVSVLRYCFLFLLFLLQFLLNEFINLQP